MKDKFRILKIRVVDCLSQPVRDLEAKTQAAAVRECRKAGIDLGLRCGACGDNAYRLEYFVHDPEYSNEDAEYWTNYPD